MHIICNYLDWMCFENSREKVYFTNVYTWGCIHFLEEVERSVDDVKVFDIENTSDGYYTELDTTESMETTEVTPRDIKFIGKHALHKVR